MKDLYYEITDTGYYIYDRNDEFFRIHQYEHYIPDKTKSYEENAQMQIHGFMANEYTFAVYGKEMAIDSVPEEYREEVAIAVEKMRADEIDPEPTPEPDDGDQPVTWNDLAQAYNEGVNSLDE